MKKFGKTKRLVFAAFALVLSMMLTITSTYAWFTQSSTPEVSGFEFNVVSQDASLLISLNQSIVVSEWQTSSGYSASLTANDFSEVLNDRLENKLGAYTSTDGKIFTDEAAQNASINASAVKGTVISFKINFRSESAVKVGLTAGSYLMPKDANPNYLTPIYTWDNSAEPEGPSFDALAYGMTDKDDETVTSLDVNKPIYTSAVYAARLSFDNGSSIKVWNPQKSIATKSIAEGDTVYSGIHDTRKTGFAEKDNYYVFNDLMGANTFAVDYKDEIMATEPTTHVTPIEDGDFLELDDTVLLTLKEADAQAENAGVYYYGSLTIYVWLEGWDSSCTNAILGDYFVTNLKFTVLPEPDLEV